MEPIEVTVDALEYTALPLPDGAFQIFHGRTSLGKIMPIPTDPFFVKWITADLFSEELAQKIGEAIENLEM